MKFGKIVWENRELWDREKNVCEHRKIRVA